MICTGNICRSPMAQKLLAHALEAEDEPLRSIQVLSAGVAACSNEAASPFASKAMDSVKLDLSQHRSRPLTSPLLDRSDLILTMTSGHIEAIRDRFPELRTPIFRFREWVPTGTREVPDPFGGSLPHYVETRDCLAEAIPSILTYLRKNFLK